MKRLIFYLIVLACGVVAVTSADWDQWGPRVKEYLRILKPTQVAEVAPKTSPDQPQDPAPCAGPITIVPILSGKATFQGVRITGTGDIALSREPLTLEQLGRLIQAPKMPDSARWESDRQLVLRWPQYALEPSSSLEFSPKQLPLGENQYLDCQEHFPTTTIKTPALQLESASLTSLVEGQAKVRLEWNHPLASTSLEQHLVVSQGDRSSLTVTLKPSGQPSAITTMVIDQVGQTNELILSLTHPLMVGASTLQPGVLAQLDTRTLYHAFELSNAIPEASPQGFAIRVRCAIATKPCKPEVTSAAHYIDIDPKTKFAIVPGYDSFQLVGEFQAKTNYHVSIRPGFRTTNGYVVKERKSFEVTTGDRLAKLSFNRKARYALHHDNMDISYQRVNINKAKLTVRRIYPQNILLWLTSSPSLENVSDVVMEQDLHFAPDPNVVHHEELSLAQLASYGPGAYQIAIHAIEPDVYQARDDFVTVITDILTLAKKDKYTLHIWTRHLRSLASYPNVTARLVSQSNQEMGRCTTAGSDSFCAIPLEKTSALEPAAILLEAKQEFSYLRFSEVGIAHDSRGPSRSFSHTNQTPLQAYLYSSRGVYRPGETVDVSAIIQTDQFVAARKSPFTWRVLTPQGKPIRELSVNTSHEGMSHLQFRLSTAALTGSYTAQALVAEQEIGKTSFLVEDFVPERIKLVATFPEPFYSQGGDIPLDIQADYLFGAPVANGNYRVRCFLEPAWKTIPGQPDFATGTKSLKPATTQRLGDHTATLDETGHGSDQCQVAKVGLGKDVQRLVAQVSILESGSGRSTMRTTSTLIPPSSWLLGARGLNQTGSKLNLEVQAFNLKGESLAKNESVNISALELNSEWLYEYDIEYGYYRWHRERFLVPTSIQLSQKLVEGKLQVSLDFGKSWGSFLVRVENLQGTAIAELPVSFGWWNEWEEDGNASTQDRAPAAAKIPLSVKTAPVRPGEHFQAEFDAPFSGLALVSIESDVVHHSQWVQVKTGAQKVSLQAPKTIPNFYVTAILFRDTPANKKFIPIRAFASHSVKADLSQYQQQLQIKAPKTIRPGQELKVEVQTEPQAEFTVAIVDQGILNLTQFKTPRPADWLLAERKIEVDTYDTYGWTLAEGSVEQGGGIANQGSHQKAAQPVKIVSWFSGIRQTNDAGVGQITMQVPAFQGEVRVMVVAAKNSQTASADHAVTIRDPIVAQMTLPRFASFEDRFEIPILVTNMTGKTGEFTIDVSSPLGITLAESQKKMTLEPQQSATAAFAGSVSIFSGQATLSTVVSGNNETTRDSLTIPIHPSTPEESFYVSTKEAQLDLAKNWPEHLRKEGAISTIVPAFVPDLHALKSLGRLSRYPYGCLEQTSSQVYPLLFVDRLLPFLEDTEASKIGDVRAKVHRGIDRILSMQSSTGGFYYWPGGGDKQAPLWTQAYATLVLLEARDQGYLIPESGLKAALEYLRTNLFEPGYHHRGQRQVSEPMMLYTLARGGVLLPQRAASWLRQPQVSHQRIDENRFLLYAAAQLAGDSRLMAKIEQKRLTEPVAHFDRDQDAPYGTSFRSDALRLAIASHHWPNDPRFDPLIQRVVSGLRGKEYLSTQELGWGIAALSRRLKDVQPPNAESYKIMYGGNVLPPIDSNGKMPVWRINRWAEGDYNLGFSGTGDDRIPLLISTRAFRKNYANQDSKSTSGIEISRRYLSEDGEKIDLAAIALGDVVLVELALSNNTHDEISNVAISDRLPAGLEVENPKLGRRHLDSFVTDETKLFQPEYTELKDDRMNTFGKLEARQSLKFYYLTRAATAGEFLAPPAKMELMYDPVKHDTTTYAKIKIHSKKR